MTYRPPKVFISYASPDASIAEKIALKLRESGIDAWLDIWEVSPSDSLSKIEEAVSSSDFILLLLSPDSVESAQTKELLRGSLASELKSRAINVLPVIIADCEIPRELVTKGYLDLRVHSVEESIDLMARRFFAVSEVDFSLITESDFENLVAELLSALGFTGILNRLDIDGHQFDIKADYHSTDPFGSLTRETWLVEVKLYRSGRADLIYLKSFADKLATMPLTYRGLIVTNGQLTSVAQNWLVEENNRRRMTIRVIDGVELKQIMLAHPTITTKHFGGAR